VTVAAIGFSSILGVTTTTLIPAGVTVPIGGFVTAGRPGLYNTGSFDGTTFVAPVDSSYRFSASLQIDETIITALGSTLTLNLVVTPTVGAPGILRSNSLPIALGPLVGIGVAGSTLSVEGTADLAPGDAVGLTLTNSTLLAITLTLGATGDLSAFWFDGNATGQPAVVAAAPVVPT
jgi:hypothetical protein